MVSVPVDHEALTKSPALPPAPQPRVNESPRAVIVGVAALAVRASDAVNITAMRRHAVTHAIAFPQPQNTATLSLRIQPSAFARDRPKVLIHRR